MRDKIRVLLAENHTIVREGFRTLLEATGKIAVVGEAENGQEAVAITQELSPDVAILDLGMPVLDGIEATRQIKRTVPEVQVVILTMHSTDMHIREAFRAGASSYLVKETAARDLITAIEAVMRDEVYLSPKISRVVVNGYVKTTPETPDRAAEGLTEREREVLKLVAEGRTNRSVADLLHISEKTVSTHRTNLMQKLDLHNITDLVRYAIREGLIDAGNPDSI